MEIDYASQVDELLPKCIELAKTNLDGAIEKLYNFEKLTRTASDAISTGRILETIVDICVTARDWPKINTNLVLASKRRGQLKQPMTKMIQKACACIDSTPDKPTKLALIDALRGVTEGKIYVEIERARLTKQLATIKEADGDIAGASRILQEIQVETFGSMEKREKVEFILDQMRLCLATRDFIRMQIISKKISTKYFVDPKTEDLKMRFYRLMIRLDRAENNYLNVAKHHMHIYQCKQIQDEEEARLTELRHIVLFALLAPYDNEQSDLIQRCKILRDLEKLTVYSKLIEAFTTQDILNWTEFCAEYKEQLVGETDVFREEDETAATAANSDEKKKSVGEKRWEILHDRVVELNIRVMSAYYTQIRLNRMAALLGLTEEKCEEFLSQLVVNKTIEAKIDRLESVVRFTPVKQPADLLNDWSGNINELMGLIRQTNHLINKEMMLNRI